ncbi:MAG TPA: hypothetical protein DD381_06430 [Lentisphaeria bacterium]|nr:MAG: hypothetical protein A2X47_13350 [Lentisphaerae bacterium GWF2_38_69]HBM15962.1 hypothetical protein [Lentisphaeria bacterium]
MFYPIKSMAGKTGIFLFLVLFFLPFFLYSTSLQYQKRLLGDKAFDSGLYDVAMNYYENYLKDAVGDSPAIRDAYFCLIATCLRANNIDEAKRLYSELSTKFAQYFPTHPEDQRILAYWKAEIFLYEEKLDEASSTFNEILTNSASTNDAIYLNSLFGKALSVLRMGDLNSSYKLFTELREKAIAQKSEDLASMASQEMIMITLATNNFDEARKIISSESEATKKSNNLKNELINIYIFCMQNNLKSAKNLYEQIRPQAIGPDYLWFFVAYSLSSSLIKSDQYSEALSVIDDAFYLAPDMYSKELSVILKINTCLKLNNLDQAIRTAKMFLEAFPKAGINGKVLLTLSEALMREKHEEDLADLSKKYFFFDLSPDLDTVKLALLFGRNDLALKNYQLADKYFDYVISKSKDSESVSHAKYLKAEVLFAKNDYRSALKEFISIRNEYPAYAELCLNKESQVYMNLNEFDSAEETIKLLINKFPDSLIKPSPYFMYALCLEKLNNFTQAIEKFSEFVQNNPESELAPEALFEAGSLSLVIQKNDNAAFYFHQLLDNYKDSPLREITLYKLIYSDISLKNFDAVSKYSQIFLSSYPDSQYSVQVVFWLVEYYQQDKQFDKALDMIDFLIKNNNDNIEVAAKCFYQEAFIYSIIEDNKKALDAISQIEENFPTTAIYPWALYLKGDILSSDGKYSDAIQAYKSAYDVSNNQEIAIASLGRIGDCFFAEINFSEDKNSLIQSAIQNYNKILDYPQISIFIKTQTLYKLGKCYEIISEKQKAIEAYHDAFYSNIIELESGHNPSKIWLVKSAIALTRLLMEENSSEKAFAAISVLKELVKHKIAPVSDFEQRIDEIRNLYKFKE